jgi:serine/threonine protein phosphatase PrpC
VIINEGFLHYALIGDAMLSIYRKNELFRISKGHSIDEVAKKQYIDGKMRKKEAVSVYKEKKLLYYLGQESHKEIEMNDTPIKMQKGDIVVLMSKGIFKGIKWIKLEEILGTKNKLEEISNEIISNVESNCNGSILLMQYKANK